jgi:type IV secretory pathway VirB10-like protein
MKHLPLAVAGALFLAGSVAVYAQAPPPKEPTSEEQKPPQGSRQQSQSKEGQGEATKSGQNGQPEGKNSRDNQRSERTEKSRSLEGSGKQKRGQDGSGSADGKSQEGQGAQQDSDSQNQQKHAGKKLEAEQRTVVKETIVERNVRPANIHLSISVGSVVPRSVTLYDLPPTLIEFQPSYSRYKFILADEDTILVIDPETWAIVDVIQI